MSDNGRFGPTQPVTLKILRYKPGTIDRPRYDSFQVDADPLMTVLDALEEIPEEYRHGRLFTRWGEALYYHYQGPLLRGTPIPSGDWLRR